MAAANINSEALSALLVSGASEDQYGLVHNDIPVVLESMIACLQSVEKHISKPPCALEGRRREVGQVVLREPYAMIQGTGARFSTNWTMI
jgi:hypothetical protein